MTTFEEFDAIQQQLNSKLEDVVIEGKKQIELLQNNLRNIALNFPNNPSVKTLLQEYLPKNELKAIGQRIEKKSTTGSPRGRKRIHCRLKFEFCDGEVAELKPNSSRIVLAKLIQNNPSGVSNVAIQCNHIYVRHNDNANYFSFTNPLPENTSGIKSVSVC